MLYIVHDFYQILFRFQDEIVLKVKSTRKSLVQIFCLKNTKKKEKQLDVDGREGGWNYIKKWKNR